MTKGLCVPLLQHPDLPRRRLTAFQGSNLFRRRDADVNKVISVKTWFVDRIWNRMRHSGVLILLVRWCHVCDVFSPIIPSEHVDGIPVGHDSVFAASGGTGGGNTCIKKH